MHPRYFYRLLLPLLLSAMALRAQNTPNLGQTAPAGSSILSFLTPPETTVGNNPNYVRSYVPMVPITQTLNISASSPAAQVKQAVVYRDGFNTAYQSLSLNVARVGNQYRHTVGVSNNIAMRESFSYLPYATAVAGVQTNAFEAQKVYNTALFPGEGYTSYSLTRNTSSATERSVTAYAPGKSRVNIAQMRGTVTKMVTNGDATKTLPGNEHLKVRTWSIGSGDMPVSTGYYTQNELFGEEVTSPASGGLAPRSVVFKDKEGRMVVKMVADGGTSAQLTYQKTYYVYDDMGRLRYTLPPKAVDAIEANSWTVDASVANVLTNLCFQYMYDNKGRAISRQFPGQEGPTEIVYDKKDRPVMSRTALGASKSEWEVSYYDRNGRVKGTSIYTDGDGQGRQGWQQALDLGTPTINTDLLYYLNIATGETAAAPTETAVPGNKMMSYAWYDNYDVVDPGGQIAASYINDLQFAEHSTALGAETPYLGKRLHCMATGSKVRILTAEDADASITGEWRTSVMFYDDKGRVTYTVSKDLYQNTPIHVHYTGMQYDFANRLLVSKHIGINTNSTDAVQQHTELTKNEYELGTGNLLSTQHKVDGGAWKYIARYEYDDMGRVRRKGLGNYGEVRDFSYNIRGQLTGINAKYAETGNKDNVSRTFGELLRYDYGFTQPRHDGKIAGMVWRGSSGAHAYGYNYDLAGRLEGADYRYGVTMGCVGCPPQAPYSWDNTTRDYTVSGLSYDRNGNIMSMNQRGTEYGSSSPVDMDLLEYDYEDLSNRLAVVVDGAGDQGMGDFRNGQTSGYSYDRNGNLVSDKDKGINSVAYNHFNKPVKLEFDGGSISYSYDAAGGKVQELVDGAGPTDYVGNFIYKENRLQYILTSEGRTVYDGDQDVFKEEFFVKDHLGNVRSVIDVTESPIRQYLATYEIASANLEGLLFDHHNEVRDDKPGSLDPYDGKSARLNGAEADRRIGTSLLVQVMAGDRVAMNVNNFYDGYDPLKDNTVSASLMLDAIVGTLAGGGGGIPGEANNPEMVGQLFTPTNYSAINDILENATDPTMPKAYLNYVLFDHDMNIVSSMTGAFQANGSGDWAEIGTTAPMEMPVNGYLAVYLSNSSTNLQCATCADIYFDHLAVRVSKGRLLEEEHYYPHGLPMAGMGARSDEFKENRYKYQGKEYIKEQGLNWMDFHARQYDPQIGRFLGVDPLADYGGQDRFSPYAAMGNEPESMVDPNGMRYTTFSNPGDGIINDADEGNINRWMKLAFIGDPFSGGGGSGGGGTGNTGYVNGGASSGQHTNFWNDVLNTLNTSKTGTTDYPIASGGADGGRPVYDTDGATIIWGERPGFFKRMWSGFKKRMLNMLKRGDEFVKGNEVYEYDKVHREEGGGIEFTSKTDGVAHSGNTTDNPDGKSVNIDALLMITGNYFTSPMAMFSPGIMGKTIDLTNAMKLGNTVDDENQPTGNNNNKDTLLWIDGTLQHITQDSVPYLRVEGWKDGMYHGNSFKR